METRTEIYQRVWKEWASTNPAAIENDDPEFWDAVRAALGESEIAKHPGPGGSVLHATGTDQSEHGKGGVTAINEPLSLEETQKRIDYLKSYVLPRLERVSSDLYQEWNRSGESEGTETYQAWEKKRDEWTERREELLGLERGLYDAYMRDRYTGTNFPKEWVPLAELEQTGHSHPLAVVPETLQAWNDPPPNFYILNEVDKKVFAGTDSHNPTLNARTTDGKDAVADLMNEHFGEEIDTALQRFHDNYHSEIVNWIDTTWTEYVGVESKEGYAPDGTETWRKHLDPRWIEGQGVLETMPFNQDGTEMDPWLTPGSPRGADESFDYDDAFSLRDFVTGNRFIQGIASEAPHHLNRIDPKWANDPWEADRRMADFRWRVVEDGFILHENETLGYIIESSKDGSNMVDIMEEWSNYGTDTWPHPSRKIVEGLRSRWANSSSDPLSLSTQLAVSENFPIDPDTSHFSYEALDSGERFYNLVPEIFDAYATSVYAHTQAGFKKAGITHVPLVRGMGAKMNEDFIWEAGDRSIGDWERGFELFEELGPVTGFGASINSFTHKSFDGFVLYKYANNGSIQVHQKGGEHQLTLNPHRDGWKVAWTKNFDYGDTGGDVITSSEDLISYLRSDHPDLLYGGAGQAWVPASIDLQPLSSFSTKTFTARSFSPVYDSDGRGITHSVIFRATVPVEWIWGHSLDGFGSLREHEMLVMGSKALEGVEAMAWKLGDEGPPSDALMKALNSW